MSEIQPNSAEHVEVLRKALKFERDYAGANTVRYMKDLAELTAEVMRVAAERDAALAENAKLREALAPSAETKAAYSGEFSIYLEEVDEHGDEQVREVPVPWTAIKAIMAAIRARALVEPPR